MNKKKLLIVIGARPNFIKAWPLVKKLENNKYFDFDIYHSGQHYDDNMSKNLLQQLKFPKIKYKNSLSSLEPSTKFSEIFYNFTKLLENYFFDGVIVFGDVNTTLSSALISKKKGLSVFHVESGLRSNDVRMPEEVNRIIIDHHSDLLFTTEKSANQNLLDEKFSKSKIKFVGNLMIETLLKNKKKIISKSNKFKKKNFLLITIHRAENIFSKDKLKIIVNLIVKFSKDYEIVFPLHPSTKNQIEKNELLEKLKNDNIHVVQPMDYFNFINLMINSKGIITDSGGIQEEACFLKKKIATLRNSTERPITLKSRYNKIFPYFNNDLYEDINEHLFKKYQNKNFKFKNWDLNTSDRIISELIKFYKNL